MGAVSIQFSSSFFSLFIRSIDDTFDTCSTFPSNIISFHFHEYSEYRYFADLTMPKQWFSKLGSCVLQQVTVVVGLKISSTRRWYFSIGHTHIQYNIFFSIIDFSLQFIPCRLFFWCWFCCCCCFQFAKREMIFARVYIPNVLRKFIHNLNLNKIEEYLWVFAASHKGAQEYKRNNFCFLSN